MSMNLLNISKEIKKINDSIDFIQTQNNNSNENVNKLFSITNEIKNDINHIYKKIDQLYNFKIIQKNNNDSDEIVDFLKGINIDNIIINKILFLNCNSLNDLLLLDDDLLEKLDISIDKINYIKNKIQEKLYLSNLEF